MPPIGGPPNNVYKVQSGTPKLGVKEAFMLIKIIRQFSHKWVGNLLIIGLKSNTLHYVKHLCITHIIK